MRNNCRSFLGLVLVFCLPGLAYGQVEARHAQPEDLVAPGAQGDVEVASPMLIELSLGAKNEGKVQRKALNEVASGQTRTFWETRKYVCDKARVVRVQVTKQVKKGMVELEVASTLSTEWYRQDLDLTLALISDGKEIDRKSWEDLTIGSDKNAANKLGCLVCGASSSKTPKASFRVKEEDFNAMFSEGRAPLVRVIVKVKKSDEDE